MTGRGTTPPSTALSLLSDAAQRVGTAQLVEAGCRRAAASAADPDLIGRVATLPDRWRPTARRARAVAELTGADLAVATHELSDDVVAAVTTVPPINEDWVVAGAVATAGGCSGAGRLSWRHRLVAEAIVRIGPDPTTAFVAEHPPGVGAG